MNEDLPQFVRDGEHEKKNEVEAVDAEPTISAEAAEHAAEAQKVVDEHIAQREAVPATVMAHAFRNQKPFKEREKKGKGNGEGTRTEASKVRAASLAEPEGSRAVPPELGKIFGDNVPSRVLEMYGKLKSKAKRESYLAMLAADTAKKEKRPLTFSPQEREAIIHETLDRIDAASEIPIAAKKIEAEERKATDERIAEVETPNIARPEDTVIQEQVQDIFGNKEGTPQENRNRFLETMGRAKEMFGNFAEGASERFTKSKEFLNTRAKEMDAKAAEMGGVEKWFRKLGENYDKLSLIHKLGVGVTLGVGAAVTAGSAPLLALGFMGALGAQRVYGMASMFVKIEKDLQEKKVGETSTQFIGRKERAFVDAALYTVAMGAAIQETIKYASETEVAQTVQRWLGSMLGHEAPPAAVSGGSEAVPPNQTSFSNDNYGAARSYEAMQAASPEYNPAPEVPQGAEAVAPVAPPLEEMPAVGASVRGYEGMMQDLLKQLPDTKPENIPDGSDLAKLYEAKANGDPREIGNAIHRIAMDHKFFSGGASARIDVGAQMSVDAQTGNILFNGEVQAPAGVKMIPEYQPETPAYAAPLSPSDFPTDSPPPETIVTRPVAKVDLTQAQDLARQEVDAASAVVQPGARPDEQPLVWRDSSGNPLLDSQGNPVRAGSYEAPAQPIGPPSEAPVIPEAPAPTMPVEHVKEFINPNGLTIDPLQGHVFQDPSGTAFAYGNDFAARFDAAQEYVKANRDAVVWVQAEKPVFIGNEWRPWVFQVKYSGFLPFGSVQAIIPAGLPDPSQIGGINPDTFIKQLDK